MGMLRCWMGGGLVSCRVVIELMGLRMSGDEYRGRDDVIFDVTVDSDIDWYRSSSPSVSSTYG